MPEEIVISNSKTGNTLRHYVKGTVVGGRTVCGRYPASRGNSPDNSEGASPRLCRVCEDITAGTYHRGRS